MNGVALHDVDCDACGLRDDAFVERESIEGSRCRCECGAPATIRFIQAPMTVGIVHSGRNAPQESKQLGTTWNTNAEKRAWLKRHPKIKEWHKGDADDRAFHDRIRAKADRAAAAQGYKDLEHKRATEAGEKKKGRDPKRLYEAKKPATPAPAKAAGPGALHRYATPAAAVAARKDRMR